MSSLPNQMSKASGSTLEAALDAGFKNADGDHAPQIILPGWKQPLTCYGIPYDSEEEFEDDASEKDEYSHRIHDEAKHWRQLRLTEMEIAMIQVMDAATDKLGWEKKINDPHIRERWTHEFKDALKIVAIHSTTLPGHEGSSATRLTSSSSGTQPSYESALSERVSKFIIEELQDTSESFKTNRYVTILRPSAAAGPDVVKSDSVVPENFRENLALLLKRLEEDPRRSIDWHPGQENVVRNLVHPSLYPLQYGRTQIMPSEVVPLGTAFTYTGQGEVLPEQDAGVEEHSFSKQFQWLPAEVRFRADQSNGVRFVSYVNNLEWHRNKDLYDALAELVQYAIPLWNRCMATSIRSLPRRIPCNDKAFTWEHPDETLPKPPESFDDDFGQPFDLEEELAWCDEAQRDRKWAYQEQQDRWERLHRKPACPEPVKYSDYREKVKRELPIDLLKKYQN
jgi:Protein of unknown function (DUF4246)